MNGARLILMLAIAGPAFAQTSDTLRAGNELYRAGEYERALDAYQSVESDDPLALFNRACALQRLGRTDEAQELLQRVDSLTRRDDLAASARYNLGAASVEQARALAGQGQAEEALDAYRRGARLYRDAYAIDPTDRDAARNIEIAGREAKALLDQMRAQQQAMQEMAEELQDLQEQQEQEAQQNQSQAQQQESGEQQESQQQASERQQQLSEQTQAARDQLRDMQRQMQQAQRGTTAAAQQEDALERAAQRVEEAMQEQQEAQRQLEQGDQQSASERQREAAEDLQQALEAMTGEDEGNDDPQESDEQSDSEQGESEQDGQSENEQESEQQENESQSDQEQGEGQSGEASQPDGGAGASADEDADPLEALAEDLLEKELEDRERLRRIRAQRRSRNAPVEKDW